MTRLTPDERARVERTLLGEVDADRAPLILRRYIADTHALIAELGAARPKQEPIPSPGGPT